MSNRSLIEFNHDFTGNLDDEFLGALRRYLTSASRESADALRRFGVTIVGMRHHSGDYFLDSAPGGFRIHHVPRRELAGGTDFSKSNGPNSP